jgi:1,4-dihydroxy-6-naphthoate synthase
MGALQRLRFGFSPCPNDTFAFHAAVHGGAAAHGMELTPHLADIEALNERAVFGADPWEVTKLSLPALARAAERYVALPSGAALGFGVGPLVVQRAGAGRASLADLADARVAVPGVHTTAFLLLSSLGPAPREVVPMRFDRILAAVANGEVDAGLVIHESRFTYQASGLSKLADLGELWEARTGGPLPLGIIAARRDLPQATLAAIAAVLRESVLAARRDPAASAAYVRAHAQEMDPEVCARHIELYVNDYSVDLGALGRAAIERLVADGRARGVLPPGPDVLMPAEPTEER